MRIWYNRECREITDLPHIDLLKQKAASRHVDLYEFNDV